MIRPLTCVCALLAGASGLYLYSEKHRTTLLDQQISKIVSDTQHTRERTAMLRAEWALLNQPDRLQGLATRFLPQLQAMAPTQFVQMASLAKRMPAPGAETPPHPIATPETAPELIGQPQNVPATAPKAAPDSNVDGMAIAQANVPSKTLTRLAAAHRTASAHDTQVADNAGGQDDDQAGNLAAADATVPAVRHVVAATHVPAPVRLAHATPHATVAPARYAAYVAPHPSMAATRPAVVNAASFTRAQPIGVAAWRPARETWPAPRAISYNTPASSSALGSSLGSGHVALPAPVPVSDGN